MPEDPESRSRIMRAVKSEGTTPERKVRRIAHALGFRFRLYRQDLPGCPDLVFPRLGKIILVHGCFWHGHSCPRGARIPKANQAYWTAKIARNRARDQRTLRQLRALGWKVLVVWECATRDQVRLETKIARFLKIA
jgi:DNA mismatch endonuclease (patch repair protein)